MRAVPLPDGDRADDLWVDAAGRLVTEPVPGAERLPGRYVAPGLVDAHAHPAVRWDAAGPAASSESETLDVLATWAESGVGLVRDTGSPGGSALRLDLAAGLPRVQAAGRFLAPAGRYFPALLPEAVPQPRLTELALAELARGSRWVKVIADFPPIVDGRPSGPPGLTYSSEAIEEMIAAVHAAGGRVAAHVTTDLVGRLVRAGVDSVEHGTAIDEPTADDPAVAAAVIIQSARLDSRWGCRDYRRTAMTEQAVRVERSGPVYTVFLHRPARRNAVDGPAAAELAAAFRAFDADPGAAVAVLHGEGGVFCSGADLTAIGTGRGNRVSPDGDGPMGVSRLRLSKPVIAAVAGYAVAGGLELALWCDLRVADETAVFGVFCRRWGVPLIDGGTVRLPRLIGTSRSMDMILTGRAVGALEAAAIGLANRVVPAGQALAAARELAAQLASFPQICLRSDRASVLDAEGLDETAALASEFAYGQGALAAEAGEGAARFAAGAGRHGSFGEPLSR